jgi:hypothetical protein
MTIKYYTKSEAGRLGAKALNKDKEKKSAAARQAAQTRKARNPDCFKQMGALSGIAKKNRYKKANLTEEN